MMAVGVEVACRGAHLLVQVFERQSAQRCEPGCRCCGPVNVDVFHPGEPSAGWLVDLEVDDAPAVSTSVAGVFSDIHDVAVKDRSIDFEESGLCLDVGRRKSSPFVVAALVVDDKDILGSEFCDWPIQKVVPTYVTLDSRIGHGGSQAEPNWS
jgi:hypothetical protein